MARRTGVLGTYDAVLISYISTDYCSLASLVVALASVMDLRASMSASTPCTAYFSIVR